MRKIILQHEKALGDTVVMSAVVRDLKLAYPSLAIDVWTNWKQMWDYNPHLTRLDRNARDVETVQLNYQQGIVAAGKGEHVHFLSWFHRDLQQKTGLKVPVTLPWPDLHLTPKEKAQPLVTGRYWVVLGGGKSDVTIKHWHYRRYQQVVDRLHVQGVRFVQAGVLWRGQTHPKLNNALDLRNQTQNPRDFFRLIYHADGVICPVTAAMHIAAAFQKPCVVIAGGREEWWWEAYVPSNDGLPNSEIIQIPHAFLHTQTLLDCCKTRGCWMHHVLPYQPQGFVPPHAHKLCKQPVYVEDQSLPKCMEMISVDAVEEAVLNYYAKGFLPPINVPRSETDVATPSPSPTFEISPPPAEAVPATQPVANRDPRPLVVEEPQLIRLASYDAGPVATVEVPEIRPVKPAWHENLLDHPTIGGKFTVCVVAYGDYPQLLSRCLDTLFTTLPVERIDLRIGYNGDELTKKCTKATLDVIRAYPVTKLYVSDENIFKYPMMRRMLHDPSCPITTKYLLWFDDDSYVVDPNWSKELATKILENQLERVGMFGIKFQHPLRRLFRPDHDPRDWIRQATWFKNKPFMTSSGVEASNGDTLHFCVGGFWAASVQALSEADVPDTRLRNNGGDCLIGEMLHQAGWKICDFNRNKKYVFSSGAERRGVTHRFPWAPPDLLPGVPVVQPLG